MSPKPRMPHSDPWYVNAFGIHYSELYAHRDEDEARRAIDFLRREVGIDPARGGALLDLCCGAGRHSIAWTRATGGRPPVGLDLSAQLLEEARSSAADLPRPPRFVRADMRRLPFAPARFALCLNLFTSFGYFEGEGENRRVFGEVARVLEPNGRLLFDHINPPWLRRHLRPETRRQTPSGAEILERRRIDETRHRVEKEIQIRRQGVEDRLLESVRFYERDELEAIARHHGLRPCRAWGDFDGSPLSPDSPRAIHLFERQG